MLKAKIKPCPNKRMAGAELKRLIKESGGIGLLIDKMDEWGWTRYKVYYLETQREFELDPREMEALLNALGNNPDDAPK